MARLEIEIGAVNDELKKILQDSKIALNDFSKAASGTALKGLKVDLDNSKVALQNQRVETEKARTAAAEARKEIAEMALANKQNKSTVDVASDSLVGMRTRLNELRSIYDRLSASQRNSIKVQQNLVPEIQRLNVAISQSEQATGRFQRNVGNYGSAIGNASGVTMEFTRIIQDAPFGMMGIGNNIQQLTANWQQYVTASRAAAAAQGQIVTTGALLRGALSSLISPAGLLTLGVAALTSGFVLYEKWQQKSAKATKEAEKATVTYIETLKGVSRAQADGRVNALKELTTVEQLYKATQNINIPMKERVDYAKELIKQGGKLFESTNAESIVAGKASEAYDKLTNSIRQTAMAQAYMQKMTDNATTALNNNLKILNEANEIQKINQQIQKTQQSLTTTAAGASVGASSAAEYNTIARLEQKRADRIKEITNLNKANSDVIKEQDMLQKGINNSLENGGSLVKITGDEAKKVRDTTKEILSLTDSVVKDSLSFYDAKLFDINKKYDEIYSKIKDSDTLGLARINEHAEKTRLSIDRWTDGLDKFSKKARGINLSGVISTDIPDIPKSEIDRINKPIISNLGEEDKKLADKLSKVVERGFRQGLDSIFSEIDDLGSNFYQVFTNVFGKLSGSVTKIFTDVLATQVGDFMSKSWEDDDFKIFGKLKGDTAKAIIAGAGLAGQAMGSLFKATSQTGQGIAGGLSGAASGFAVASAISSSAGPWGAAIGGLLGVLSGIFGAKERKRQEKLQEQQLEEQRKQTALQQRMAALTFTSSIVGQQTNQGIVVGASRNEFGDFTIKVEGRDLVLVYDREKEAQKRGL